MLALVAAATVCVILIYVVVALVTIVTASGFATARAVASTIVTIYVASGVRSMRPTTRRKKVT